MIRLVSDAGASGADFAALMEELVREGELELMDAGAVDEVGCGEVVYVIDKCGMGCVLSACVCGFGGG